MSDPKRVETHDIALVRNQGLRQSSCGPTFGSHSWVRAQSGETVLVVLCATCGRYPIELLDGLTIRTSGRAN